MSFDPNMTYLQSLQIVARGLVQSPFRKGDMRYLRSQIEEIGEALLAIGCTVGGWMIRLIVMIILPLSAPLLTWLAQFERKKTAKQHEEARKRIHDHYGKLVRTAQNDGGME